MIPQLAFAQISLAYPLLMISAPILAMLFLLRRRTRQRAPVPSVDLLRRIPTTLRLRVRGPLLGLLAAIFVAGLAIAAARPQRVAAIDTEKKRHNLILALDLSRSMESVDFADRFNRISRIHAVKAVVRKFIDARDDDRIGIVVFGAKAFVQAPLTLDHALLEELIGDLQVGVAGDATAIGDGLGLSLKRLKDVPPESAAVILLTDGVSNAGQLEPLAVADIAKQKGIKIHTIGIGSADGILEGGFMAPSNSADFDEETLKKIAATTGGVYFNARNLEKLTSVYDQIDALERTRGNDRREEIAEELFAKAALAALLAYIVYLLAARAWLLKVP